MARTKKSSGPSRSDALVIGGWQILAHPLLIGQLVHLIEAVEQEARKKPDAYRGGANAKLLVALAGLMFETIPADPTRNEYRQGNTLGPQHRHWFRAKFGRQRFRLFFRYSAASRIIIYAWVNDSETLRTRGARTDAYAVFSSMLKRGNPPDDWDTLVMRSKGRLTPSLAGIRGYVRSFGRP